MQKKHAKGFFMNSAYRKTRALKSLLHGNDRQQEKGEDAPDPHQCANDPGLMAEARDTEIEDPREHSKNTVGPRA